MNPDFPDSPPSLQAGVFTNCLMELTRKCLFFSKANKAKLLLNGGIFFHRRGTAHFSARQKAAKPDISGKQKSCGKPSSWSRYGDGIG